MPVRFGLGGFMSRKRQVYKILKDMHIRYSVVGHPAALTTQKADSYIARKKAVRTKTLFLTNRNNTIFYLLVMDAAKCMNFKKLAKLLGDKRIRFASDDELKEKMRLPPGVVSIFGLLNNPEKDIRLYLDIDLLEEKIITFHPNDKTKTIFISTEDMIQFTINIGYNYGVINIPC